MTPRAAKCSTALDAIVDPCSGSLGRPIGLVAMGIVDSVAIDGDTVTVAVLPTFPTCLFRGVFEEEIERELVGVALVPGGRDRVPSGRRELGPVADDAEARAISAAAASQRGGRR